MSVDDAIGEAELVQLQAEGWEAIMVGPQCGNGWPAVFRHQETGKTRSELLSNDLSRWSPEALPQQELFTA